MFIQKPKPIRPFASDGPTKYFLGIYNNSTHEYEMHSLVDKIQNWKSEGYGQAHK